MRVFAQCAATGILAAVVAVSVSGTLDAQTKDPAAILASAREALGGEKKLTAVKTFTAGISTLRQTREDLQYTSAQIERMEADDKRAAELDPLAGIARDLAGGRVSPPEPAGVG